MPKKKNFEDIVLINEIIDKCDVCYIGMVDEEQMPYVLPFNFGYHNNTLYLHGSGNGKKIDILKKNINVCVAFSTDHELKAVNDNVACSYSMSFRSVLMYGKVSFITDYEKKEEALNYIMQKYTGKDFSYNKPAVNDICIFKVNIEKMTGKSSGY